MSTPGSYRGLAIRPAFSLWQCRSNMLQATTRASVLSLTPSGVRFLAEQHREHARRVEAVLEGWDDDKAKAVFQGLTDLDTALSRTVADMRAGGIPTLTSLTTAFADSVADDTASNQDQKAYA